MFRIIGPAISILIAALAFFFFVRPTFSDIQVLQSETRAYEDAIAKAGEFNTLLGTLLNKKNALSASDLDRLDTLLPKKIDSVRALVDLEHMATSRGLLFDHVVVDLTDPENADTAPEDTVTTEKNGLQTQDVDFSVVGTYADFKDFLEDIEKSLMLMDVTEIEFQATEGELISYDVTVRLYAFPDAE